MLRIELVKGMHHFLAGCSNKSMVAKVHLSKQSKKSQPMEIVLCSTITKKSQKPNLVVSAKQGGINSLFSHPTTGSSTPVISVPMDFALYSSQPSYLHPFELKVPEIEPRTFCIEKRGVLFF